MRIHPVVKPKAKPKTLPPTLSRFEASIVEARIEDAGLDSKKESVYSYFRDGVFLLRNHVWGRFFAKSKEHAGHGLKPCPHKPFFELKLPPIPISMIQKQVSFYRWAMKSLGKAEAYSVILWDFKNQRYVVDVPEHKVTQYSVKYDRDKFLRRYPPNQYMDVMSCHSHNTMAPRPSHTDDKDAKHDCLYMIAGNLDKPSPTFNLRASLNGGGANEGGAFIQVSTEAVIPGLSTLQDWPDCHPKEWEKYISQLKMDGLRGRPAPWSSPGRWTGHPGAYVFKPIGQQGVFWEDQPQELSDGIRMEEVIGAVNQIAFSLRQRGPNLFNGMIASEDYKEAIANVMWELMALDEVAFFSGLDNFLNVLGLDKEGVPF